MRKRSRMDTMWRRGTGPTKDKLGVGFEIRVECMWAKWWGGLVTGAGLVSCEREKELISDKGEAGAELCDEVRPLLLEHRDFGGKCSCKEV